MRRVLRVLLPAILLALILAAPAAAAPQDQEGAVVRAVFFYSPTCGHCQYVITEVFPLLFDQYGDQIEIIGIDITNPAAQPLFQAAIEFYEIPDEVRGSVPLLTVGDTWLIGSRDIPEQFPGMIEAGLAQGGIDWPAIPGLAEAIGSIPPGDTSPTTTPSGPAATERPTPADAFAATSTAIPLSLPTLEPRTIVSTFLGDPAGNSLAVVVLAGMVVSLVVVGLRLRRPMPYRPSPARQYAVLFLSLAGMAVAGYLTFVETSGTPAVCGPVGDCNTVQQSPFAVLFGVIPVGALGLAGYAAILAAWLPARRLSGRAADWASVLAFGLAAFGTLFSLVLTFLEPFVIGASCIWCLASAVIMTALLWLTSGPGIAALLRLEEEGQPEAEAAQEPGAGQPAP